MKQMTQQDVFVLISDERKYQKQLQIVKGWDADEYKSIGDFLTYIQVYLDQAKFRLTKEIGDMGALDELRKVAALTVACMEQFGAPARNPNAK